MMETKITGESLEGRSTELLRLEGITKEFSGVFVLKGVGFHLQPGQGLALVGENGAGKSTLMKILSGVYPSGSYNGEIFLKGKKVSFLNTSEAHQNGISIIHQELNLFPELTVGENIFLSHLPRAFAGSVDYQNLYAESDRLLAQLNVRFSSKTKVGELTPGEQQMVEIAKALGRRVEILILDEPTSSLGPPEVETLTKLLKKLQKENGMSFIYISHRLEEVFELCSQVCVLRDGKSVLEAPVSDLTQERIIEQMVGRPLDQLFPPLRKAPFGPASGESRKVTPMLEVKDWKAFKFSENKQRVKGVSFSAYGGEILGISGMMGSGRSDILLSLFGHEKYETQGEVFFQGEKITIRSPQDALKLGFGLVTEDRKKKGLHLDLSVEENLTLSAVRAKAVTNRWGRVDPKKVKKLVDELVGKLKIKISDRHQAVKTLSGGNQQKIAIGKWLAIMPRVLFLDEPTRGVDVGAKWEIYSILMELVDQGVLVILVSSELPEIIGLCHRVLVVRDGQVVKVLTGSERTQTNIMKVSVT